MPIPKIPVKTSRQILSLARKNPGATTRQIVRINNNASSWQNALNELKQANLYLSKSPDDYSAFLERSGAFDYWKDKFVPSPDIKIFAEPANLYRTLGYPGGNFMGQPTYISRPRYDYKFDRALPYPKQIQIQGRTLEQTPLSKITFLTPHSGYYGPQPQFKPQVAPEIEDLPFKDGGVIYAKSGIHIKKENRGKFTSYCGGKVTSECIARGKASSNPTIRKRATFAANARKWKH